MKRSPKILFIPFFFVMSLLFSLLLIWNVSAESPDGKPEDGTESNLPETAGGRCGENLTYTLTRISGGTYSNPLYRLEIHGTGDMYEWNSPAAVPWADFKLFIVKADISEGVTSIADHAFDDCNSELFLDEGDVYYVDNWAVICRSNSTDVVLRDDTVGIANGLFKFCRNLQSVTIPNGLKYMGERAFLSSESPEPSIHIRVSDLAVWCKINFKRDVYGNLVTEANPLSHENVTLYLNDTPVTDLVLSENMTDICSFAFFGYKKLKSVTIPDSVTGSIGTGAFMGCSGLTRLTIGNGITKIGADAFRDCENLCDLVIGNRVESIGDSAFFHCSDLKYLTIPDSVQRIGNDAFVSCSSLANVTIGKGLTHISGNAFALCGYLATMTFFGDAPTVTGEEDMEKTIVTKMTNTAFSPVEAYYPSDNATWTKETLQQLDSRFMNWYPYDPSELESESNESSGNPLESENPSGMTGANETEDSSSNPWTSIRINCQSALGALPVLLAGCLVLPLLALRKKED